jgi:predicted nucleic acid-binding protein
MAAMLDTCVVVDFPRLQSLLPENLALSAVVIAELAAGIRAVPPGPERDERERRFRWARTFFDPHPFDTDVAVSYGKLHSAMVRAGRSPRPRLADLMIAATAEVAGIPLYTSNADDFVGLEDLVEIIVV